MKFREMPIVTIAAEPRLCISHEGGLSNEGVGSFLQHIKSSMILSTHLGADLTVRGIRKHAGHGRGLDFMFRNEPCAVAGASCLVNHTLLMHLLPSICSNTILPATVIRLLSLESCSTIYHNVTVKETLENYNDCVGVNYNHYISLMRQSSTQTKVIEPTPAVARVGIHFRWGDVRNKETKILDSATPVNKRSISVRSINQIWHNIEFVNCGRVEVKLYMQAHIPIKKETFHFNYTVVDGDDWADLVDYQTNDIFIQGKSSWGIMGAFATTGKVVFTPSLNSIKYEQQYRKRLTVLGDDTRLVYDCKRH